LAVTIAGLTLIGLVIAKGIGSGLWVPVAICTLMAVPRRQGHAGRPKRLVTTLTSWKLKEHCSNLISRFPFHKENA
jgi:hypothetical protein